MPEDLDYLNAELERVSNALIDAREGLGSAHRTWSDHDARLTVFNKSVNVARSVHLGVVFMSHHLCKPTWWGDKAKYGATKATIQQSCDEFNMFLRVSFIQGLFFGIESSCRVFVRALDPSACSGGCAEFKNIYEWLVARLNLPQYRLLLDLIRNVRNVMHNNGLFFPKSGANTTINYKGTGYQFEVGKPNDFVTWKFMLELMPDVTVFLLELVEAGPLGCVAHIPDPT